MVTLKLACGALILACSAPFVIPVVFAAVLWEACDRGFAGGFVQSNNELSGFLLGRLVPWAIQRLHRVACTYVKAKEDSYVIACMLLYAGVIPALFLCCFAHAATVGYVSLPLCFAFHVFRIGPYFMNFAYVYTLCHKEGHSVRGMYVHPYNQSILWRSMFNWWVGLFYGVLPASFAVGHSINHHRYNNGEQDVVSTADKPRDSFQNWVAYLPRWTLYALNVSTTLQFWREGQYRLAFQMLLGSAYFWAWAAAWARADATFAAAYVLYPFFENVLLLACVNWTWHAFLDPDDPENEYAASVTILDGTINVLNEDYHVVHHQYPGEHWSKHQARAAARWKEYAQHRATCFQRTHVMELFGMLVAADYDALAQRFVDVQGLDFKGQETMTLKEKKKLLRARARACRWGPYALKEETPLRGDLDRVLLQH